MKIRVSLVVGLLAISGCATTGGGTQMGNDIGKLTQGEGSKAGDKKAGDKKVATAIIAAMAGGLIGGAIGTGLDDRQRRSALEAEYRALEYTQGGQPVSWKSPSGPYGEVVAAQPYRVGSQDCRQYSHTVFAGGQSRNARGTACRNADGSWTPLL